MINHNKIYVLIALGAMAYWCNPVQAQERFVELNTEKSPYDIIGPQDEGPQDTSATGGDTATGGTTSFAPIAERTIIRVFPVPAVNYFVLEVDGTIESTEFILYSIQGKEVREFNSSERVDISTLPRGTYIIRAKDTSLGIRSERVFLK